MLTLLRDVSMPPTVFLATNRDLPKMFSHLLKQIFVGYLVMLSPAATNNAICQNSDAIKLERSLVATREGIKSAHIDLSIRIAARKQGTTELLPLEDGVHRTERIAIWIDGPYQRFDHSMQGVTLLAAAGDAVFPSSPDKLVQLRVVVTPDGHIIQNATKSEGRLPTAVLVGSPAEPNAAAPLTFECRWFGMIPMPYSLLHSSPVEQFYGFVERGTSEVTEETRNNVRTIKSAYVRNDGKEVAIWIAPEMNNEVVRAEFAMTMKDGLRRIQAVESQLEHFSETTWFPRQVEYTCHSGDELIAHERWSVERAEFNSPIDKRTFTIEGLQLESGTYVVGLPQDIAPTGTKVWDGHQLADTEGTKNVFKPITPTPGRNFTWIIVLNLVVIGVLLLWQYVRTNPPRSG